MRRQHKSTNIKNTEGAETVIKSLFVALDSHFGRVKERMEKYIITYICLVEMA